MLFILFDWYIAQLAKLSQVIYLIQFNKYILLKKYGKKNKQKLILKSGMANSNTNLILLLSYM